MPPKPWETRARVQTPPSDISSLIKNNNVQEDIKALPPTATTSEKPATTATTSAANRTTSSMGSMSSYGGYGGYGGGYGGYSSYGGYGGYGSMYGGGMYGGYGGMYGLGSAQGEQKGFLTNTLAALHSFGFLIHSLGEIGKTLQSNIDGIHRFYDSFKNLCVRLRVFTVQSFMSFIRKIKQYMVKLLNFIKQKLLMMNRKDKSKTNRFVDIMIRVLFVLFVISLYPLILKPKKV